MIALSVADYCQNCGNFSPKITRIYLDERCETVVSCENEQKCEKLVDYLKRQKEDKNK